MIFSADIEDWQQSVFDFKRPVSERVVRNTTQLLEILAQRDIRGTFLSRAWWQKRFRSLCARLLMQGMS
ncbi:MAG: hypothetical protein R3E95_00940 [Thiolinea sp.]